MYVSSSPYIQAKALGVSCSAPVKTVHCNYKAVLWHSLFHIFDQRANKQQVKQIKTEKVVYIMSVHGSRGRKPKSLKLPARADWQTSLCQEAVMPMEERDNKV